MTNTILSLILSLHIICSAGIEPPLPPAAPALIEDCSEQHISRLWWGMIDPELSAWCARLPLHEENADTSVLWDWSWRGFWASLFDFRIIREAPAHASV